MDPSRSPDEARNPARAPLLGLVLAGGESVRMGVDKGSLDPHGVAQSRWAYELLRTVCGDAYVSIREAQRTLSHYRGLPLIVDRSGFAVGGPAAGLASAWRARRDTAWLVLAVDMPAVDQSMLEELMAARDADCIATAWAHTDGTLEPLCTIWEPRAAALIDRRLQAAQGSLREVLEMSAVRRIVSREPWRLRSVNTPDAYYRVREK